MVTDKNLQPHYSNKDSSRGWFITINNYTEQDYEKAFLAKSDYVIVCKEIGKEKKIPHIHIFIYKESKITFAGLRKAFPRANLQKQKGTHLEAQTYIKKDGDWKEQGQCPAQGQRTDLLEITNQIINNQITVENLILEHPIIYHVYGRTLEKVVALQKQKQFRTTKTTCCWIYGVSGSGKSHAAFTNYNPETHYNHQDDGLWWDNYNQQDTVIINEFRGEIKYKKLLELTDKYPTNVSQRNKAPCPFISKHIIITSSKSPEEIYSYLGDSMYQLLRRITVIYLGRPYDPNYKYPYLEELKKIKIFS
jgi:hypothetical protein